MSMQYRVWFWSRYSMLIYKDILFDKIRQNEHTIDKQLAVVYFYITKEIVMIIYLHPRASCFFAVSEIGLCFGSFLW